MTGIFIKGGNLDTDTHTGKILGHPREKAM